MLQVDGSGARDFLPTDASTTGLGRPGAGRAEKATQQRVAIRGG